MERLKRFKEEYRIRERKNNLYQVRMYARARMVNGSASIQSQHRTNTHSSPTSAFTTTITQSHPQVGEEIFGLPVTEYPDLRSTERELKLLDQLYGLYTEVLDTIRVRALGGLGLDWFACDVSGSRDGHVCKCICLPLVSINKNPTPTTTTKTPHHTKTGLVPPQLEGDSKAGGGDGGHNGGLLRAQQEAPRPPARLGGV